MASSSIASALATRFHGLWHGIQLRIHFRHTRERAPPHGERCPEKRVALLPHVQSSTFHESAFREPSHLCKQPLHTSGAAPLHALQQKQKVHQVRAASWCVRSMTTGKNKDNVNQGQWWKTDGAGRIAGGDGALDPKQDDLFRPCTRAFLLPARRRRSTEEAAGCAGRHGVWRSSDLRLPRPHAAGSRGRTTRGLLR